MNKYRSIFHSSFGQILLKRNDYNNAFPCVFPCNPHAHTWHHTMGETGKIGGKSVVTYECYGELKLVLVSIVIYFSAGRCVQHLGWQSFSYFILLLTCHTHKYWGNYLGLHWKFSTPKNQRQLQWKAQESLYGLIFPENESNPKKQKDFLLEVYSYWV